MSLHASIHSGTLPLLRRGQTPNRLNRTHLHMAHARPARPCSSGGATSVILRAYVPRGLHANRAPRSSLRAACVAAATSSQTVTLGTANFPEYDVIPRQLNTLSGFQDAAQALAARLEAKQARGISQGEYNKALRGLCSLGERWSEIRRFYDVYRRHRIRMDIPTYLILMTQAIEARQVMEVIDLLHHSQAEHGPVPVRNYCSLISRLLKLPAARGIPAKQAALALWRALRDTKQPLDEAAFRTGMNLYVELGQVEEATRLMEAMRAAGFRPGWGAYHVLIKYHAERGDMDGARKMFVQLRAYKNKPLDISAYNTLLAGFVRLGDLTQARAVLDKARREGVAPDAFTYSTYASGLATAGRLSDAEGVLPEMEAAGLKPNAVVYGAILDGCVRLNDWTRAGRLLARMRNDGLKPTLEHYNILIRGRTYATGAVHGGGAGAMPSAAARSGFAGGAGHVDVLMAELRAAGLRPDAVTYGTLVDAAVRSGSIDAALEVVSAMRLDRVQPDGVIFTSLMKLFREQGCQAQALGFFEQMAASRHAQVDCWALSCLAAVHASAGNMEDAEVAQRRANQMAREQGRLPPPEAAYALLQGYGQQRRLRPALLSFRRFLADGGRPHRKMCEYLYRLCLSQFDFGAAAQVLRAMRLMRGLQLREDLYRQKWEEAQRRLQARRQGVAGGGAGGASSGGGDGDGVSSDAEKWKWWFGLPNNYYGTDWR